MNIRELNKNGTLRFTLFGIYFDFSGLQIRGYPFGWTSISTDEKIVWLIK
jgi:hypothetical protein